MTGSTPRMRRPREVIERFEGGYLVDFEGVRTIEQADVVASLLLRIWPDVSMRIAAAWRPELEEAE